MNEPVPYVPGNPVQSNQVSDVRKALYLELSDLQRVVQELITAVVDLDSRVTALGG